jgi:DNA-binding Lrp family transcriptional regulator
LALKRLNRSPSKTQDANHRPSLNDISIVTPYDDLIPSTDDPAVQFYFDAMRIYLGLCSGSITMETALQASDKLKDNPEYTASPTNPTLVPINEYYRVRMLENIKTLRKFNLFSVSALRSAYSFVFLAEDAPVNETDFAVLSTLCKDPLISLVSASDILNLAPRTVARSLERLRERNNLRISCLVDYSTFNLQSVVLFFTLQKGIEWDSIEKGFIAFPFTKNILRTAMTDIGYCSFLIPNFKENLQGFIKSLREISKTLFEYSSIHIQTQSGAVSNVSEFHNQSWELPNGLETMLNSDEVILPEEYPPLLDSADAKPSFTREDFIVAATMQLDARMTPGKLSENLRMRQIEIDPKRISSITRRLHSRNLTLPYLLFALPGLSSNFCFEIVCADAWKPHILSTIRKFPWAMYYISSRGIIVWTMVPGNLQVEYYQLFRALERKPGVNSVQSIMTISQLGSKSMLDLTRDLTYIDGYWSAAPEDIDASNFIDY